ncbi:MAG: hypothetical protein HC772_06280 [Leptolyngbyaceae cyanobacterium CRU_2_3]|nr:hypothetical protein [Leptolyngbyaceae cyanobacterium CRU_2_3]
MPDPSQPDRPSWLKQIHREVQIDQLVLPLFIMALALTTGQIEPRFWSSENLLNLSRQLSTLMILSVGQTLAVVGVG